MAKQQPKETETALARTGAGGAAGNIVKVDNYAIMQMAAGAGSGGIRQAMEENLGGSALSAFDFQRIRVPAGGGLIWEMVDPETGETDGAKTLRQGTR
jgi:hypothetical protein